MDKTTFLAALQSLLNHNRTAITMIVSAVLLSVYNQIVAGHFSWRTTLLAALTVIAGMARSALAPKVGTGTPGSVGQ